MVCSVTMLQDIFIAGKEYSWKGRGLSHMSWVSLTLRKFEDLRAVCPTPAAYTQRSRIRAIARVRQKAASGFTYTLNKQNRRIAAPQPDYSPSDRHILMRTDDSANVCVASTFSATLAPSETRWSPPSSAYRRSSLTWLSFLFTPGTRSW